MIQAKVKSPQANLLTFLPFCSTRKSFPKEFIPFYNQNSSHYRFSSSLRGTSPNLLAYSQHHNAVYQIHQTSLGKSPLTFFILIIFAGLPNSEVNLTVLKTKGSEKFVDKTKQVLGIRAKGRKVAEAGPVYPLREPRVSYLTDFELENDAIGAENTYFWSVY
jgi:hypothetical protein